MRVFLGFSAALAVSGCLATSGNITAIETLPPGALVTVEGIGECETPCTIDLQQTRRVTIAKAGYNPVRLDVAPGADDISVELELAAPTDEVDSTELPDIQ